MGPDFYDPVESEKSGPGFSRSINQFRQMYGLLEKERFFKILTVTCVMILVGETALIRQDNRSASIVVKSDCVFLEIKRDDFMTYIENKAELGVKVLLNLAESSITRLKQSSQDAIILTANFSITLSK